MNYPAKNETAIVAVPQQIKVLDITKLESYRANANVLVPQAKLVPAGSVFTIRLERVDISPDPNDRDIYQLPGTYNDPRYALSAKTLLRIARAAGIHHLNTKILSATSSYVLAQARVRRRDESGEWVHAEGTYELDLEVVEEDLYADNVSKFERWRKNPKAAWAQGFPKSDEECRTKAKQGALKIRRHKVSRAETGAHCRAIRAMLGIENGYRQEDLAKPFLVPSTVINSDDPDVKASLLRSGRLTLAMFDDDPRAAVEVLAEETGKTPAELRAEREVMRELKHGPPASAIEAQWGELGDDDIPPGEAPDYLEG